MRILFPATATFIAPKLHQALKLRFDKHIPSGLSMKFISTWPDFHIITVLPSGMAPIGPQQNAQLGGRDNWQYDNQSQRHQPASFHLALLY
jgi:hypothetical protein